MTGWIDEAKQRWGVTSAARALGLEVVERGVRPMLRPCPACGEEQRTHRSGAADRRPPVNVLDDDRGWRCQRGACEVGGDVIDLVAVRLHGHGYRDLGEQERAEVRQWFAGDDARPDPAPRPAPVPRPPVWPERAEVVGFWQSCGIPAAEVPGAPAEVESWLRSRLDRGAPGGAARAIGRDMVRVHPPGRAPAWARGNGAAWADGGYLAIFPWYDEHGDLRSVTARRTTAIDGPKGLAPVRCSRKGLVLANAAGVTMLRTGAATELVIAEGETDWLTWCVHPWPEPAPAVLGICAGAWTPGLAARVPTGILVRVATDPDAPGDRYANEINVTLGRRCRVVRWRP